MNNQVKIEKSTWALIGAAFMLLVLSLFIATNSYASTFPSQSERGPVYASSTAYTLAWGVNNRVVATSTQQSADSFRPQTQGRTAVSLEAINCTAGAYVSLGWNDVNQASSTQFAAKLLSASSTLVVGDTVPMSHGSIKAMSVNGSCTLLVNEWRTQF